MVTASSQISALSALVEHVRHNPDWVVIVAPPGGGAQELQKALTVVRPPDAAMGGRTLLMPSGGRVTVCGLSHPVDGEGYLVLTMGFDRELSPRNEIALHVWRQKSKGTVLVGEQPGELRIIRK